MSVKVYVQAYTYMGLFINYVVSAGGEEGNPKYDLTNSKLVKKTTGEGGGSKIVHFETK